VKIYEVLRHLELIYVGQANSPEAIRERSGAMSDFV